jgi:hypothetical protein
MIGCRDDIHMFKGEYMTLMGDDEALYRLT